MTPPAAGAGSAVSSPASRPAATAPIPASSSPTSATATADRCTRTSTAGADRRKTTSRLGNHTPPPTDLVSEGHRQPVPPVPARRRLLAAVEPARADAQGLVLAGRPVRHAQAAPRQDRRPCRRNEDEDQVSLADERNRPIDLPPRARPPAASRHLTAGAAAPPSPDPTNLQPLQPRSPRTPPTAARAGSPSQPRDEQFRHIRKHSLHSGTLAGLATINLGRAIRPPD